MHNGEPKEDSGCKDEPFSRQLPTTQNHIKWGELFDTQQEVTKNQENELNATTHTKQESNLTSEDARMQRIPLQEPHVPHLSSINADLTKADLLKTPINSKRIRESVKFSVPEVAPRTDKRRSRNRTFTAPAFDSPARRVKLDTGNENDTTRTGTELLTSNNEPQKMGTDLSKTHHESTGTTTQFLQQQLNNVANTNVQSQKNDIQTQYHFKLHSQQQQQQEQQQLHIQQQSQPPPQPFDFFQKKQPQEQDTDVKFISTGKHERKEEELDRIGIAFSRSRRTIHVNGHLYYKLTEIGKGGSSIVYKVLNINNGIKKNNFQVFDLSLLSFITILFSFILIFILFVLPI